MPRAAISIEEQLAEHLSDITRAILRLKSLKQTRGVAFASDIDESKAFADFAKPEREAFLDLLRQHGAPLRTAEIIFEGLVINYCNAQALAVQNKSIPMPNYDPLIEKLVEFMALNQTVGKTGDENREWVKEAHDFLGIPQMPTVTRKR